MLAHCQVIINSGVVFIGIDTFIDTFSFGDSLTFCKMKITFHKAGRLRNVTISSVADSIWLPTQFRNMLDRNSIHR